LKAAAAFQFCQCLFNDLAQVAALSGVNHHLAGESHAAQFSSSGYRFSIENATELEQSGYA
jgi:hypothetical protein